MQLNKHLSTKCLAHDGNTSKLIFQNCFWGFFQLTLTIFMNHENKTNILSSHELSDQNGSKIFCLKKCCFWIFFKVLRLERIKPYIYPSNGDVQFPASLKLSGAEWEANESTKQAVKWVLDSSLINIFKMTLF